MTTPDSDTAKLAREIAEVFQPSYLALSEPHAVRVAKVQSILDRFMREQLRERDRLELALHKVMDDLAQRISDLTAARKENEWIAKWYAQAVFTGSEIAAERGAARAEAQGLKDKLEALDHKLRKTLWLRHHVTTEGLYGDDGEMQCNRCMIDFKRQPLEQIEAQLQEQAWTALAAPSQVAQPKPPVERETIWWKCLCCGGPTTNDDKTCDVCLCHPPTEGCIP